MQLYNTLTRKIEELTPLNPPTVTIYTCGPTVYDRAHIGNLRTYVFADTLHRVIEAAGFRVKRVMNYTDVDDKTIRRSRETYPDQEPMQALKKLTTHYTQLFLDDNLKLGNRIDNLTFMSATDNIETMKQLIIELWQGGFAYIADDGVYFSIEAYRKSGKKYGQLLELTPQNTSHARIQNDEYDKDSVHDFALWKTHKPSEPSWQFELDGHDLSGRPGWHIECSAMSRRALGQPFDIHTGGVDNIFPHHENEIAQSTALEKNPVMAKFFIHGEHLLIDNAKMAKSAQNFYTLQDVIAKGIDPIAFRLLVLQAHYRSQTNLSWESLEAAHNRLQGYRQTADYQWQAQENTGVTIDDAEWARERIRFALQNDLNTPIALAELSSFFGTVDSDGIQAQAKQTYVDFLSFIDAVFGFQLTASSDITDGQKQLIVEREKAREARDWVKSDELREQLEEQDIGLRDTPHGAIWYRL